MERSELLAIVSSMEKAELGLYYPNGDQESFWSLVRESSSYEKELSEIRQEGERLSAVPVPELSYSLFSIYSLTGSRLEYERVYFERRRMMNTFTFLSLIEPERKEHLNQLGDILWSICNEFTWCLPAHLGTENMDRTIDLFSAETGFALSEIRILLGDRLAPLLHSRIQEEVRKRLFMPYLTYGPYSWETATHNWAAVCAGSIGSAALLILEDPEVLTDILKRVQVSMNCYLEGFGEDGACLEGLGYWNYGFGYYVYYADLLRKRSKGALNGFALEKVHSIAGFQQKCFLNGDLIANFSDSQPEGRVHMGLSHYLSAMYPDVQAPPLSLRAAYHEDHCSRWAPAFRNLIWKDTTKDPLEWGAASYYLPDAEWLLSRHADADNAGTYGFAAKGGHNDEPHNHNDLGQFILLGNGTVYLSDLGSGEYTSAYFGEARYSYDCNGSQGHSVPIIDGQYQVAGAEAKAVVLKAETSLTEDVLVLELSGAYLQSNLHSLNRSFVWQKREFPTLTMSDEFHFAEAPAALIERFVTFCQPLLDKGSVILKGKDDRGLRILYDASLLLPIITEHSYRDHFGAHKTWLGIDFHSLKPAKNERYVFEFQFINNLK
ncbi:heparinase II/III family protein [Paenibacillus wynnii]|uniref:Heparinase n=1 Tax=Paenibacillus wynnii TaxID=268407 RepID=A0A098M8P4_9BACL|nr:heparinase II/III family protein [Paenibacillus wynnii]KGE17897.1 hypothetical protein PWYN_25455 [Paenibacillus wynnii]